MTFASKSGWVLAALLAALLGNGQLALAADAKAAKYYEDALVRYEKKDLDGAVIQLKCSFCMDLSLALIAIAYCAIVLRATIS